MLKILRYVLSVVAILIAAYVLITQNFNDIHILSFFFGLMMLVMGLEEFRKERKAYGWLFVVVFLYLLFVSIHGFLLRISIHYEYIKNGLQHLQL